MFGFSFLKILAFTLVFSLPVAVALGKFLHDALDPKIEEYH